MSDKSAPPEAVQAQNARKMSDPIPLSEPIVRGETKITEITLRKPKAGELRGLSVQDLMTARVTAVLDVLPRIAMPPITQPEADNLEAEDLAACSGAIIDFFLTPSDRKAMEKALNP